MRRGQHMTVDLEDSTVFSDVERPPRGEPARTEDTVSTRHGAADILQQARRHRILADADQQHAVVNHIRNKADIMFFCHFVCEGDVIFVIHCLYGKAVRALGRLWGERRKLAPAAGNFGLTGGGQKVAAGEVLVRQTGSTKIAGPGTYISKNFTIHAAKEGIVGFKSVKKGSFTGRTHPRTQVVVE